MSGKVGSDPKRRRREIYIHKHVEQRKRVFQQWRVYGFRCVYLALMTRARLMVPGAFPAILFESPLPNFDLPTRESCSAFESSICAMCCVVGGKKLYLENDAPLFTTEIESIRWPNCARQPYIDELLCLCCLPLGACWKRRMYLAFRL